MTSLRVLLVEDRPEDAELNLYELRRAGFEPQWWRVDTEASYRAHLQPGLDVILADYDLPSFTALDALRLLHERGLDIPLIVVTGAIGDEAAVHCLRQGAFDFLLKDRLARLGQSVSQALEQARLREERRLAVAALAESEKRYRQLVETLQEGIVVLDLAGVIALANPRMGEMLGQPLEILRGTPLSSLTDARGTELVAQVLERCRIGQHERFDLTLQHRDGRLVQVSCGAAALTNEDGESTGVIVGAMDVTAQRQAEEALRNREHYYRSLIENGSDLIGVVDTDGVVRYASPSLARLLGYSPEEAVGRPMLGGVLPADRENAQAILADVQRGTSATPPYTLRMKHRDGSAHSLEFVFRSLTDDPVVRGIVLNARDITDRLRLEEQFRQAQKMESVGRLAGGVTHDFGNALTVINVYCDMALRGLHPSDPLNQELKEIRRAADRAGALTRQLLAFSRRQMLDMRPTDLNQLIDGLGKMLSRLIGEDIMLTTKLNPNVGPVKADPAQIEQVVVNLVVNARDAMPNGGRLTIETGTETLDDVTAREYAGLAPGRYTVLSASDTGVGMSDQVKDHLFEPFFTTKETGKGTGLGLATVYGIVRQHRGDIRVHSEPGDGATFRILLPSIAEAAESATRREEVNALPRGAETLLVAEDEPALRASAVRVLEDLGYTVFEAADGTQALRIALDHAGRIDLLLTDLVMPGMSGSALATLLEAPCPDLRILFISGYPDEMATQQHLGDKTVPFLQKPFTTTSLATKVREVLDRETG